MKKYVGKRVHDQYCAINSPFALDRPVTARCCCEVEVTVVTKTHQYPLDLHLEVYDHSPTGFEWGYNGSGPSQLALAMMCDYLDDSMAAQKIYQDFKRDIIASLSHEGWELDTTTIDATLWKINENRRSDPAESW